MKENENPSAFPHVVYNQNDGHWDGRYEIYKQDGGMTLRDYAAIRFIAAQISSPNLSSLVDSQIVKVGLSLADEFLAQRAARKEQP